MRPRRWKFLVCTVAAFACLATAIPASAQSSFTELPADAKPSPPAPSGPPAAPTGTLTFFTDRPTFEATFPGLTSEDFSATLVGGGAVLACPSPFNSTTNNGCFAPGGIVDGISIAAVVNGGGGMNVVLGVGFLGVPADAVGPNSFADDAQIDFSVPTTVYGHDFICPATAGTVNIEVFGAGGSLGTDSSPCGGPPGNFWGVAANEPITMITFQEPGGQGELFMNVLFGDASVPTMSEWGLILLTVVLLAMSTLFLYRRRHA